MLYNLSMEEKIQTIRQWLGSGSINLFGHPFAGKDTQGILLSKMFHAPLVAGGEILRSYPDQTRLKQLLSSGKLIPSDLYLQIILPYLSQDKYKGQPLILSSVGRMKGEEHTVLQASINSGHPIRAAVLLRLSDEAVWDRFTASQAEHDRGERTDDKKSTITTRLHEFHQKTMPVINFYERQNLLVDIDGTQDKEHVTEQIINALFKRANTHLR
jgi:adenylate kinase